MKSAWGEWAEEAKASDDHWAYLYGLSYRRAETFLELLGEQALKAESQAELIEQLQAKVRQVRQENADLAEELEVARCQLDELDAAWPA